MSETGKYTWKEELQNWFYYNKLWVFVGCVIVYVAGSMIWNALGIGQVKPDYSIAYIGSARLPDDCVEALETELAALGEDLNGDGRVAVSVTQHVTGNTANSDNIMYGYAAGVTVLADITEGTSYYFLVEDPQAVMQEFQIFANADGSMPDDDDYSAEGKVLAWTDCPVLTGLELGTYTDSYLDQTETGDCQSLLSGLYLGRRFYYDETDVNDLEAYDAFWQKITAGAGQGGNENGTLG